MTHLHVPDGVLPVWLWLSGAALTAVIIAIAARIASGPDFRRRLPVLSMTAAFMIVAMSVPVIPAAYHVQLAAVAGIILGPALGVIAAFIVNLLLALVGHGGITTVGLNTLIVGAEVVTGWALFRVFRAAVAPGLAAGGAAFLAMVIGAGVMIGVVALASPQVRTTHLQEMLAAGEAGRHAADATAPGAALGYENLSTTRFAALVVGLGALGWLLEAVVTALIVRFAASVKPDLVGLAAVHEPV
jgi:cobalt/nickel transport system permease protein